ncbi:hypothetical protein PTD2_02961 [Pseudoalteromonas tunicata D2]|uniref:Uncharacterized protein n=1 Tax=Pseudoalteromonas tunicata D2 TaxID=87626 RepID=A4C4L3_9GAMM|nr:hypothetical protein PTD2_02961 [Pseudoalteromonas tunicata D2]
MKLKQIKICLIKAKIKFNTLKNMYLFIKNKFLIF